MRFSPLVFLLGGVLSGSLQASEASDWLQRMGAAGTQLSFGGTYIYERSGNFSSHRIWHRAQPPNSSSERLLQLDGQAQEILLSDGQVSCASRNLVENHAGVAHLDGSQLDISRVEQVYELKLLGNSRVAGRSSVVLLLLPRDADRYARELHLDRKTGLLLKSLLLNSQGQLLERLQFTSLSPQLNITDKDLQPVTECIAPVVAASSTAQQAAWQVGWMPVGFVLLGSLERQTAASTAAVQSLMFDDGLARFSIFLEALDDAVVGNAHVQLGPTVVVSRPINTARGMFMVTVVGEIPLATAERVVMSVTSKDIQGAPHD